MATASVASLEGTSSLILVINAPSESQTEIADLMTNSRYTNGGPSVRDNIIEGQVAVVSIIRSWCVPKILREKGIKNVDEIKEVLGR